MPYPLTQKQKELLTTLAIRLETQSIGTSGTAAFSSDGVLIAFRGNENRSLPDGWSEITEADLTKFDELGFLKFQTRRNNQIQFIVDEYAVLEAKRNNISEETSLEEMRALYRESVKRIMAEESATQQTAFPSELQSSLQSFRTEFPDTTKTGFIIMRFGKTPAHNAIVTAIKDTLKQHGLVGIRADHRDYNPELFPNVKTYMHGCGFGIAVFERIEEETFNPNIALEVGYMLALRKPVCLLKDRTLTKLHSDLIGRLYKEFDPQSPSATIPPELEKWLADNELT